MQVLATRQLTLEVGQHSPKSVEFLTLKRTMHPMSGATTSSDYGTRLLVEQLWGHRHLLLSVPQKRSVWLHGVQR